LLLTLISAVVARATSKAILEGKSLRPWHSIPL
jgi:hypothetical protein